MTDGSDGNDERPSDADAAPESSDDAVTPGGDEGASESPATDDGADSSDSTPDDDGSSERDESVADETAAEGGGGDADDADTGESDGTEEGDADEESSQPQPEAALDPSATPPTPGNGAAGDTADAGDDDSGGGFEHVPDEEWKDDAGDAATANGSAVGDGVEPDIDEEQPIPGEPDRDVAGVADDRMVDTTAEEAAEEEGAPIAGEELVDRPGTTPEERAEGDAPLAEDVVGEDVPTAPGVDDDEGGLFGEGPESDEEMPLTAHIEEMMYRLAAVFAVGGIVTFSVLLVGNATAAIPSAEEIIIFLWDSHVDFQNYKPYVYGPLEFLLTKLKVAGLAGVIASLPVFVYQTYGFMRPGLYPHERRYYLAAIPTSLVLALVGVAFAHFLVLPAIFQYFISYTEVSAELAFGLRETFNLILLLMGYMAVVFQIPLFIQLATMMGVVTREWLEDRRLLFWGSFLGISFVVSPDPTGMSPIIVAATMVVLFEGTLTLLRWTGN